MDQDVINNQSTKKCPFCAEEILADAVKCKHCSSSLITNVSESGKIKTLSCDKCGGEMARRRVATNTTPACISLVLGFLVLFWFWPLGLVFIFVGIIMGVTSKRYWICRKCSYKIEKL